MLWSGMMPVPSTFVVVANIFADISGSTKQSLVGARLRHVAGTKWGTRSYMDMTRLTDQEKEAALPIASA